MKLLSIMIVAVTSPINLMKRKRKREKAIVTMLTSNKIDFKAGNTMGQKGTFHYDEGLNLPGKW